MVLLGSIATAAPPVTAQSLGDVARQEESRRATAKKSTRVFTNASLAADAKSAPPAVAAPAPAPAGGYVSKSTGQTVSMDEIIARSQERLAIDRKHMDENYWRRNAAGLRAQIDKAQSQVEGLSADVERTPSQQILAARALERAEKVLADLQERWRKLEESAHYAKAPKAWLEP